MQTSRREFVDEMLPASLSRCSRESAFDAPSTVEPGRNRVVWNARLLSPFAEIQSNAAQSQWAIATKVRCLLALSGPNTIAGLIGAVVPDAVNAVLQRGTRPHVSRKHLERVAPPIAYGNPACAVVGECLMRRLVAPILHLRPRFVQSALGSLVGYMRRSHAFDSQASARHCVARPERPLQDRECAAAATSTMPTRFIGLHRRKHGQMSKLFAAQIHTLQFVTKVTTGGVLTCK
jgi:hypothetical protein